MRSGYSRGFLDPLWSEWQKIGEVERPPSADELLTISFLGWTSLGNGDFFAEDFGQFQIIDEDMDWGQLEDGQWIWFGPFDASIGIMLYLKDTGWAFVPLGRWPYCWLVEEQEWYWIAPRGSALWSLADCLWEMGYSRP